MVIIQVEAYTDHCLPKLVVDLSQYHVLTGAKSEGKTTLPDIPVLIGGMLRRPGASWDGNPGAVAIRRLIGQHRAC